MRIKNQILGEIAHIGVLDDASHLYIGQRECFRQVFQALGLGNRLVKDSSVEFRNRTVGANRTRMDRVDVF